MERGADDDRSRARLDRKNEVADELGAGLEQQDVAGQGAVQGRLEIVTRRTGPGPAPADSGHNEGEEHQRNRCPQPHRLEGHVAQNANEVPAKGGKTSLETEGNRRISPQSFIS